MRTNRVYHFLIDNNSEYVLYVKVVPDTSIMRKLSMSNSLWRLKRCWGVFIERGAFVLARESLNFTQIADEMILIISDQFPPPINSWLTPALREDLAKRGFDDRRPSQNITTCCCFSDFYIGGGCSIWDCSLAGMAHSSWRRIARFERGYVQ